MANNTSLFLETYTGPSRLNKVEAVSRIQYWNSELATLAAHLAKWETSPDVGRQVDINTVARVRRSIETINTRIAVLTSLLNESLTEVQS